MDIKTRLVSSALLAASLAVWPVAAGAMPGSGIETQNTSNLTMVRSAMDLGSKPEAESAKAALRLLGDNDSSVRAQASASLARLGEIAFPAMIESMDGAGQPISTTLRFGNPGRPPTKGDYLAYSFINSRADPGQALVQWATVGNPGDRTARLHFAAVVLGARGESSLPHARRLLEAEDPSLWNAGIDIIGRAHSADPSDAALITRRIFDAGATASEYSVYRLSRLGDAAQPHLLKILTDHPAMPIRIAAAEHLDPKAPYQDQELDIFARSDGELHLTLLRLLVTSDALPARASPSLLKDIADEDLEYSALGALSRVQHSPQSAQLTREALLSYLTQSQADGSELEDADLAILALGATGPEGIRDIKQLLLNAPSREKLCTSLQQSADGPRIEGPDPRREITDALQSLALKDCPPPKSYSDPKTTWSYERVTTGNMPQLFALLTYGAWMPSQMDRACTQAEQAIDADLSVRKIVAEADWKILGEMFEHCGAGTSVALARDLLARLQLQEKENKAWIEKRASRPEGVFANLELLRNDKPTIAANLPFIMRLLSWTSRPARSFAVSALAALAEDDAAASGALAGLLDDKDVAIAQQAAEAIAGLGQDAANWDEAADRLIIIGVTSDVHAFLEDNIDDLRPPEFMLMSGSMAMLPAFPWPPPRYASLMMFGRDADRALLGQPGDKLDTVQKNIDKTLASLDPGFQSKLFSVPGGFIMLTRMEQIAADGSPLAGRNRWRDVRPPPSSMSDFFVRLFLAPPGYYRTIAFLFTDRVNFGYGAGSLPSFDEGGDVLPPDLAQARYDSRQAYVLVYAFEKRDTGKPHLYTLLNAREHLRQAGLLQRFQSPR